MADVHVSPDHQGTDLSVLLVALVAILVLLGIFAYANGWLFFGNRATTPDTTPDSNINVTIPSAPGGTTGGESGSSGAGY